MTPQTLVVTGATGFTGAFVVRELRQRFPGAAIRCLVRPTSRTDALTPFGVELLAGDLRDPASLRKAFDGADTLVNVASLGFDWIDPLFDAVRSSSLTRGVFISTTAILTKLPVRSVDTRRRGEALVQASGVEWTILRPTMIYGTPADRNISRLIRFVRRSPIIPLPAPGALQQPIHVEDVARAAVSALASPAAIRREYNIAGRNALTLEALVRTVVRASGLRRLLFPISHPAARRLAATAAMVLRRPLITLEQIDRLHEDKAFDYATAQADFNFQPRTFEEGLESELALIAGA